MIRAFLQRIGLRGPGPFDPSWDHQARGRWGEDWAAWWYFRERGAAILDRNVRVGGGELDLVVREGDAVVFVEVKTRDPRDPEPLSAVRDGHRRRNFRSASRNYLERLPRPHPPVRHDVLLVTPDEQAPSKPQINHFAGVFVDGGE